VFHFHLQTARARAQQIVSGDLGPRSGFWTKAVLFLNTFDPVQVRYAGYEWRKVVEYVATAAEIANKVRVGLVFGVLRLTTFSHFWQFVLSEMLC
jgi:COP9 signalosome complex subunit 3